MDGPRRMMGVATRAGLFALLLADGACRSGYNDPAAATDIRIHDLRDAVRGAPVLPRGMDEVLRLLPPARRDEYRRDGHGGLIHYSVQGRRYEFRAPGKDRVLNTADDYVVSDSVPVRDGAGPADPPHNGEER